MKRYLPILFAAALVIPAIAWRANEKEPRHKYTIRGTVYVWRDSSEREPGKTKWRDQMKPAPGILLYVRSQIDGYHGKMPIVDSIVSDSAGRFTLQLYQGKYQFIEPWKAKGFAITADTSRFIVDTACFRERYNSYECMITVNKGMDSVDVPLFYRRKGYDPCLHRKQ